jgi:uncharacterized protein DUF6883
MATRRPLPNADRAVVPRDKLEDYLLDPEHEIGRHKARVFAAALGIGRRDWEYLRDQLLAGVLDAPTQSVRETRWGALYEVTILVEGLNGQTRQVMTVWLVAADQTNPRLVTAYVAGAAPGA